MAVELSPITRADVPAVAQFLHSNLNGRLSVRQWAGAMVPPWSADAPNHGFQLRVDGVLVGALLAFYSEREVGGTARRFCNLGAWCVLPEHRFRGLRMLTKALAQKEYVFTDLSPSGNVVELNDRLGFTRLDTTTDLVANLPVPALPGVSVTCDPARIEAALTGEDLRRFRDHRGAAAARHLLVDTAAGAAWLVYRRSRRKGLPLFAALVHVSDPAVLARTWPAVGGHLMLHHGLPFTLSERRIAGVAPAWSHRLRHPRQKMVKGEGIGADEVDDLYSELLCVPW